MPYNFNRDISTEKYSIQIDDSENYGYFEHKELGEDVSGGLWFNPESKLLDDYDGVSQLPKQVKDALNKAGHIKDEDMSDY